MATEDEIEEETESTGTDWEAEAKKWKRFSRQHETAANEMKAELEKLKGDAGSADQSEMDKLRSSLEKLSSDLADERRKTMVAEIAAERGLSPAQAKRLSGKTREEIESDADDMVEAFGIKPKGKGAKDEADDSGSETDGKASTNGNDAGGRSKPKEKLRGGASTESADDRSGEDLAKAVWERTHGGI